ncbi:hypothetical protein V8E36_003082 [Tilletia maclaganii]
MIAAAAKATMTAATASKALVLQHALRRSAAAAAGAGAGAGARDGRSSAQSAFFHHGSTFAQVYDRQSSRAGPSSIASSSRLICNAPYSSYVPPPSNQALHPDGVDFNLFEEPGADDYEHARSGLQLFDDIVPLSPGDALVKLIHSDDLLRANQLLAEFTNLNTQLGLPSIHYFDAALRSLRSSDTRISSSSSALAWLWIAPSIRDLRVQARLAARSDSYADDATQNLITARLGERSSSPFGVALEATANEMMQECLSLIIQRGATSEALADTREALLLSLSRGFEGDANNWALRYLATHLPTRQSQMDIGGHDDNVNPLFVLWQQTKTATCDGIEDGPFTDNPQHLHDRLRFNLSHIVRSAAMRGGSSLLSAVKLVQQVDRRVASSQSTRSINLRRADGEFLLAQVQRRLNNPMTPEVDRAILQEALSTFPSKWSGPLIARGVQPEALRRSAEVEALLAEHRYEDAFRSWVARVGNGTRAGISAAFIAMAMLSPSQLKEERLLAKLPTHRAVPDDTIPPTVQARAHQTATSSLRVLPMSRFEAVLGLRIAIRACEWDLYRLAQLYKLWIAQISELSEPEPPAGHGVKALAHAPRRLKSHITEDGAELVRLFEMFVIGAIYQRTKEIRALGPRRSIQTRVRARNRARMIQDRIPKGGPNVFPDIVSAQLPAWQMQADEYFPGFIVRIFRDIHRLGLPSPPLRMWNQLLRLLVSEGPHVWEERTLPLAKAMGMLSELEVDTHQSDAANDTLVMEATRSSFFDWVGTPRPADATSFHAFKTGLEGTTKRPHKSGNWHTRDAWVKQRTEELHRWEQDFQARSFAMRSRRPDPRFRSHARTSMRTTSTRLPRLAELRPAMPSLRRLTQTTASSASHSAR